VPLALEPESDDPDPLVAPDEGEEPEPPALPLGEALEELPLELDEGLDDEPEGLEDEPPLLMPELEEPDWRLVVSLDEPPAEPDMPPEDEPDVAPLPAPRLESPALSQPYRPPTAIARGSRTKADFLSIKRLL
jgi:hypothetical protein